MSFVYYLSISFVKCKISRSWAFRMLNSRFSVLILYRCLLGGIPVVTAFCTNEYNYELRTEVARFVHTVCCSNNSITQMFLATRYLVEKHLILLKLLIRGFPVIVKLLEPNYEQCQSMIHYALESIIKIFKVQVRSFFCVFY